MNKKVQRKYNQRYSIITVLIICAYLGCLLVLSIYGIYCHVKHSDFDMDSDYKQLEVLNGYTRIDNPNAFNDDCYLDETYYNSSDALSFDAEALLFYEKTGIQLYYYKFDIEDVDSINSDTSAKIYALSKAKELIQDDEYAVVVYSTNTHDVYDDSGETTYEHTKTYYCNNEVYYGPKTSSIFDSQARQILASLLSGYYNYFDYDDYDSVIIGVFDRFLVYTGFIEDDLSVDTVMSDDDIAAYQTKCDICKLLLLFITVIFTIAIIIVQKHKLHMIETVEILNCDINDNDELTDKYVK